MKAVIDSDVLIDFLQGLDAAAAEIDRYEDPCYSVISWMEVMIGAETDAERFAAETLFDSLRRIELRAEIDKRAVDRRRVRRLANPKNLGFFGCRPQWKTGGKRPGMAFSTDSQPRSLMAPHPRPPAAPAADTRRSR